MILPLSHDSTPSYPLFFLVVALQTRVRVWACALLSHAPSSCCATGLLVSSLALLLLSFLVAVVVFGLGIHW